jgi:monoamine oxidase
MRKPKNPLLRFLQIAFHQARHSNKTAVENNSNQNLISRKAFIKDAVLGTVAISATGLLYACKKDVAILNKDIRIGIIGGGIAGLHAAYILKNNGYYSEVFEGSNRTGGRIFTAKDLLNIGITTELGGEFIDSGHEDMFNLANEFGLPIYDLKSTSENALLQDRFFFGNQVYELSDVVLAFQPFADAIQADIDALPDEINYTVTDATVIALDNTSLETYLQQKGITGWLYDLLNVAYVTEYGLELAQQSSINFLFLFDPTELIENGELFGYSDERYKIAGGNEQIVKRLAKEVPSVVTDHKLTQIKSVANQYHLTFENGVKRTFDRVIITIPFTMLREVDIQVEMPQVKKDSIQQLGYGKSGKLLAGFNTRIWRTQNTVGKVITDKNFQLGWDSSQLQPGTAGGYSFFVGGDECEALGDSAIEYKLNQYLQQIESVYPGITADYNGKSSKFNWAAHPFTKCGYACYKPGQWTTIGGAEIEPVGNLFFAGEHCSADFQGYMNGGAETGRVAAENVLKTLKS